MRLGETGGKKNRPKTAKYKEVHKTDEPGVGEIALSYKRPAPVTQDREVELARKKLFKKLKEDKLKKKQLIEKAVKKHVTKPPRAGARPVSAVRKPQKDTKEVVIDENNGNDYERFLNGMLGISRFYIS